MNLDEVLNGLYDIRLQDDNVFNDDYYSSLKGWGRKGDDLGPAIPAGTKSNPIKLGYPNEGYQRRPEGPSKSQGQSSFQRNTVEWKDTPSGKYHQKQIDLLTKKIERSKEEEQAWYKERFPLLFEKQAQDLKRRRMRKNVIRMQGGMQGGLFGGMGGPQNYE